MDRSATQQSRYLLSKLQDNRFDENHKQGNQRSREGRDDNIFETHDEDKHRTTQNQDRQFSSPPAAPSAWRGIGRSPETTPSRRLSSNGSMSGGTPRSMGARDVEEQVDKLLKQNFDLKLEVFHLREWKERAERKWGDAQRLSSENEELLRVNRELANELKRRDQAVDEAVVMICDLEERLKILEEELKVLNAEDNSQDEGTHSNVRHDKGSCPAPKDGARHTRTLHADTGPETKISFLEDSKPSTNVLRSMYFQGDKAVRPMPSHATLASGYDSDEDNQANVEETPTSPVFSVISETELRSLYGDHAHKENEMPEHIFGLGLGLDNLPIRESVTKEGTFARVHRWVADGTSTIPIEDRDFQSIHHDTVTSFNRESVSHNKPAPTRQRPRQKTRDNNPSNPPITLSSSNATKTQSKPHASTLASATVPDPDQFMPRPSQAQGNGSNVVTKKPRKKHHPASSTEASTKTRVSSQNSNMLARDGAFSTPEMIASRSSESLQSSLKESHEHSGHSPSVKYISDSLHSHDGYGDDHGGTQNRPVLPPFQRAEKKRAASSVPKVSETPYASRNSTVDLDGESSRGQGPAPITTTQIERIGPFVSLRASSYSSTTSTPAMHVNQPRQPKPMTPEQASSGTAHVSYDTNDSSHQRPSSELEHRGDPSLRRRASLRNRVKRSLGRRNSMTGNNHTMNQEQGVSGRRNSITRLFSFGSTHESSNSLNTTGTNHDTDGRNTPARPRLSRRTSSAANNSTSSDRPNSQSDHSYQSNGTSIDSRTILTPSATSSSSRGVTVTTVRLPFATANPTRRKPFPRRLSLSGPNIETKENGSVIGFPRRGQDGRVASVGPFAVAPAAVPKREMS